MTEDGRPLAEVSYDREGPRVRLLPASARIVLAGKLEVEAEAIAFLVVPVASTIDPRGRRGAAPGHVVVGRYRRLFVKIARHDPTYARALDPDEATGLLRLRTIDLGTTGPSAS